MANRPIPCPICKGIGKVTGQHVTFTRISGKTPVARRFANKAVWQCYNCDVRYIALKEQTFLLSDIVDPMFDNK